MNLLKYLEEHSFPTGKELTNTKHKAFKEEVLRQTQFIDQVLPKPVFGIRLTSIVEGITEVPTCKMCDNHVGIRKNAHTNEHYAAGWAVYCGLKCSNRDPDVSDKKRESTDYKSAAKKRAQYYKENPDALKKRTEKTKQTNLVNSGGLYTSNLATPEHRELMRQDALAEYGVEHYMKADAIKEKTKIDGKFFFETEEFKELRDLDWEKNGHPMTRPEVLDKRDKRKIEKYGRLIDHTQEHISEESLTLLNNKEELSRLYHTLGFHRAVADVLGVHQSSVQRACSKLGIPSIENHTVSLMEVELREFVYSIVGKENVQTNVNLFGRNNFDIFIPSKNLAIEFNGVYWHSDKFKEINYHQNKSKICMENGVLLVHVWEDDWKSQRKQTIIKNKIKSKLGLGERVYARKCEIVELSYEDAHRFLDQTHIQGKTTASVWLGLKHEGEIVSCLGLKRMKTDGHWDLVRYSTSKAVVGGFSKLLKRFKTENEWKEIITYAHLDYSHGNLYDVAGFDNEGFTVAGMWYLKGDTRYRRELFMKHKLKDILEGFDDSLTEYENMKNHGFSRIYDAGSIKYRMTNNT